MVRICTVQIHAHMGHTIHASQTLCGLFRMHLASKEFLPAYTNGHNPMLPPPPFLWISDIHVTTAIHVVQFIPLSHLFGPPTPHCTSQGHYIE